MRDQSRAGLIALLTWAATAALLVVAVTMLIRQTPWHGTTGDCLERIETLAATDRDFVGVEGNWTWLPAGLHCEWRYADGRTYTQGPDWTLSGVGTAGLIGVVASAASLTTWVRSTRDPR